MALLFALIFGVGNLYPDDWDSVENSLIEQAYLGRLWPFN